MSRPVIHCNECGTQLDDAKLSDEIFLLSPGSKEIAPQRHQRMFVGHCPEHGRRYVAFPNEGHSTLLASRLLKLFSNAERKSLRTILPAKDRVTFQASLNGQYAWDESDVARWKAALEAGGEAAK